MARLVLLQAFWAGGVSLGQGQSGGWLAGQQVARGLEAGPWGPMSPSESCPRVVHAQAWPQITGLRGTGKHMRRARCS